VGTWFSEGFKNRFAKRVFVIYPIIYLPNVTRPHFSIATRHGKLVIIKNKTPEARGFVIVYDDKSLNISPPILLLDPQMINSKLHLPDPFRPGS
jgi:hypothetical protein